MKEAFSFVRTPDFHTLENWNYYFVFYNIYTMYTVFISHIWKSIRTFITVFFHKIVVLQQPGQRH